MLELAGDSSDKAAAEARAVMAIETQMAQASKTRVERRDPEANYHKMDPAGLRALTPDFSWETYFREVGFPNIHAVNVGQPEFFQALDKELKSVPISDWKIYLRWHLIRSSAPALSGKFVDENFNFYGRTLTAQRRFSRAGSAASTPPTVTSAKRSGKNMWRRCFLPKPKRARTKWSRISWPPCVPISRSCRG